MCLAIPARITALHGNQMATIDLAGVEREVSVELVDAAVGDYVIVHVGIAIATLDQDEAEKTLAMFDELAGLQGEDRSEGAA